MTDTTTPQLPPLVYGVWIAGEGWLKKDARPFADLNPEMADQAARMLYPTPAEVRLFDDAMLALEHRFLECEAEAAAEAKAQTRARNERKIVYRFTKWLKVLFGGKNDVSLS